MQGSLALESHNQGARIVALKWARLCGGRQRARPLSREKRTQNYCSISFEIWREFVDFASTLWTCGTSGVWPLYFNLIAAPLTIAFSIAVGICE
jgi:hypothetical protein